MAEIEIKYVLKRENIPTLTCPGCGGTLTPEEGEWCTDKGSQAVIEWSCANPDCPYGPRPLAPGEMLD